MRLEVLVCGNDYNQIRYLREKNESTKSESVQGMSNRTKVKSLNQNLKASSNSTGCSSTKLLETATPKARKQSSKNQMQGIKSNNHITGYFLKCEPMHRETTTKDTLEVDSKKLQLMRNIETFQPEN